MIPSETLSEFYQALHTASTKSKKFLYVEGMASQYVHVFDSEDAGVLSSVAIVKLTPDDTLSWDTIEAIAAVLGMELEVFRPTHESGKWGYTVNSVTDDSGCRCVHTNAACPTKKDATIRALTAAIQYTYNFH